MSIEWGYFRGTVHVTAIEASRERTAQPPLDACSSLPHRSAPKMMRSQSRKSYDDDDDDAFDGAAGGGDSPPATPLMGEAGGSWKVRGRGHSQPSALSRL